MSFGFFSYKPTIGTAVIHHYYFLQKVFRGAVDDASQRSFDDGQGLVQVDQHNAQSGQLLRVTLRRTPVQHTKQIKAAPFVWKV